MCKIKDKFIDRLNNMSPEDRSDYAEMLADEYKKGYNACLREFKIPNEFGEKSL